jgi:mRNA-degrading endonuclease RelE of RelBE toxin-antitoxin system
MGGIDAVELVEEYVFSDLSSSTFSDDQREQFLDDVDKLEEDLTVWDRQLTQCVTILTTPSSETVYRRRVGDLRGYYIREGSTLYCIGVGKRKTTYDRDLDTIRRRAGEHRSDSG